jgi:hypothetical protein
MIIKHLVPLKFGSLYCLLLFFLSFPVLAETPDNTIEADLWTLLAKPRICVSSTEKLLCKMETDIVWLGQEEADICLSSSKNLDALQCWISSSKGKVFQEINSDKKITYWLTRQGESHALAKIVIRIVKIPQKKIRRRRRHVWSLL